MARTKLTHALWARITAFFLLVVMTAGVIGCAGTVILAAQGNWYFKEPDYYKSGLCQDTIYRELRYTSSYYENGYLDEYLEQQEEGNYLFVIRDNYGNVFADTLKDAAAERVVSGYTVNTYTYTDPETGESSQREVVIDAYLRSPLLPVDEYYVFSQLFTFLYGARYGVIVAGLTMLIAAFALFVFLMCSAGHKPGEENCVLIRQDRIPFDLYLTISIFLGAIWGSFVSDAFYSTAVTNFFAVVLSILFYSVLVYAFCMTLAARLKVGKWWQNTVIYRFFRFLYRLLRRIILGMSLTWRVVIAYSFFVLLNTIAVLLLSGNGSFMGFLVFMTLDLGVLALLCIITIQMKTLQKGGEALANGELDHKVNTVNLYYDFKRHGENLNRINEGITKAVDARMKSERFKTELITNVSHDIKTPLTSIINYIDLLKKEPLEGTKAEQYIEVLERQSAKLKKLTEDIIEASKASAGVITVNAERTDVVELLNQSLGEYGERLERSDVTAVLNAPETGAYINADGRLLWRVFDNILQNICKYALPGTRAYFDVTASDGMIEIVSKNISASALNISAEELMERFIRGDSSRGSEGSGLGISIAKSLTELQGGTFTIQLDGDLFKVVLAFPEWKNEESEIENEI